MAFLLERHRSIDTHGQSWVDAGIVTREQLDAIRDFERRDAPAPSTDGDGDGATISPAAELLLYLAAALVATGSIFVVSRFWDRLGSAGQFAIAAVVAVSGYGAALSLQRVATALDRPAAVVRLVGTAGLGLGAAVLARWLGADDGGVIALAIGPPVLVAGGLDWRNRDRPLAFLTTVAGASIAAGGIASMIDPEPEIPGAIIWMVSGALLALALLDRLRPAVLATIVASAGMFIGVTALNADTGRLGILVVLANSAALVAVGLAAHSNAVLAIGLVQFTLTLPQAMGAYLHGLGAALGMLLAGMVILAVLVPRLIRRSAPPDRTGRSRSGP